MSSPSDVTMTRFSHALNSPIQNRCAELTVLIDRCGSKELQSFYPMLLNSIFGTTGSVGWGLRGITQLANPKDFEMLHHFLGPLGPLFRLIHKLLKDSSIKFEFSASFLPAKIKNMLEHMKVPPFYLDLISVDMQTRKLQSLTLNAFDFYMFQFAYHLINPWQQRIQNLWNTYNSIYYILCCDYMLHFLPTNLNVQIEPLLKDFTGKNPLIAPLQSVTIRSNKKSTLLKPDVFLDQDSSSDISLHQSSQQHPRAEIWRSETVVHVFIDIWLNNDQLFNYVDTPLNYQLKIHELPAGEYIRILRTLVKQLHSFSASAKHDNTSLGELKKIVHPMLQGKMYIFLRHLVYRWPLDGSFRLVLELWLSFIQPWRYMPCNDTDIMKTRDFEIDEVQNVKKSSKGVPPEYREFIAENLICYTVILQQLIQRFSRIDLTSPKNAMMLFRVTKVFSQPNLVPIICSIEKIVGSVNNSPTHSFSTISNTFLPPIPPSSWSGNINPNLVNSHLEEPQTNTTAYVHSTLETSTIYTSTTFDSILNESNRLVEKASDYSVSSKKSVESTEFAETVANSKLAAIVRHKMFELEGPEFYYRPMFYVNTVAPEIYHLINCIQSAENVASEIIRTRVAETKVNPVGFFGFFKTFLTMEENNDEFSLDQRNKVLSYLTFSQQNLIDIYRVNMSGANAVPLPPPEPPVNVSQVKSSSSTHSVKKPKMEISPSSSKLRVKTIKYEGDPDLHPIRSYESAFLVKSLYQISQKFNTKYYDNIQKLYYRSDVVGAIVRNVLMPPKVVYVYDKSIPGMSQRVQKSLPPRLSLRFFANSNFLSVLFLLSLVCYLIGLNPIIVAFVLVVMWSFFIVFKSLLLIPDSEDDDDSINNDTNVSLNDTFNDSF